MPTTKNRLRYEYDKLVLPQSDELHVDLKEISLEDQPAYTALSYTWGSETTKYSIDCSSNGFINVTQNLYDALEALQSTKTVWLWIDQICINQQDENEKAEQLPRMADIYNKAQQVIVWLGPSEDGSEIAMDFFRRLAAQGERISPHVLAHLGYRTAMSIQLHDLLSRPWFSRVWTLQEAAVATKCLVQCGSDRILWTTFERFNENCQRDLTGQWSNVLSNIATARDADSENIQRFITSQINEIAGLKEAYRSSMPVASLTLALERHRNCGCKVDLDRIYAIWAFLPDDLKHAIGPVAYGGRSRVQLYADVAYGELISPRWPEHLGAAGRARQRPDFRAAAPSWVPDWTYPQRHHTFWALDRDCRNKTSSHLYQASDEDPSVLLPSLQPNGRRIYLRGKILTTVAEHAPPFLFSSSVLKQKSIRMNELRAKTPILKEDWKELNELLESMKIDMKALEQDRVKQINDCLVLAMGHCGESMYPIGTSPDTRTAVYHSLLGGAKPLSTRPGLPSLSMGGVLVRATDDQVRQVFTDPQLAQTRLDLLQNACKSRVFFVTESKHVGLAPGLFALDDEGSKDGADGGKPEGEIDKSRSLRTCATRVGDRICVVKGCATPFVLRSVEQREDGRSCWELIGECYVHGLMDREAAGKDWVHVSEEDIVLV